jgi:ABC-type xylose transport system permease subunit
MEISMFDTYQTTLTNFGRDVYIGDNYEAARAAAVKSGFESCVLLDGALIGTYSPISGWKHYGAWDINPA